MAGGDPAHIPGLTYERFLDCHSRYYHPSNSYILPDGQVDIQEILGILDEEFLSGVTRRDTNVIQVERDGEILLRRDYAEGRQVEKTDRNLLTVEHIVEFADCVAVDDVRAMLNRQIQLNTAIAEEGLRGSWGAGIGKVLLGAYGDSVHNRAKAYAATGSDARMGGCELPVVINSGMICDGAKASCAAKIVSAVEAGLLGWQMQKQGMQFYGGDGIVVKGVENTIKNVGRLARDGMAETDREIISIMVGRC